MPPTTTQVPVWDVPIRLFHWILVVLIAVSWVSQWREWMDLHYLSGETILTLLLFRIGWGLFGSRSARFTTFLKSPLAALRHLAHLRRREPDTELSHNAAGGWMVLIMLALLFAQVGTGLFSSDDDAMIEGPLRHLVSKGLSEQLGDLHGLIFTGIEIAIVLHVCTIALYGILKGQNLVRPMVTGRKSIPGPVTPPSIFGLGRAAVILLIAIAVVVALVRLL